MERYNHGCFMVIWIVLLWIDLAVTQISWVRLSRVGDFTTRPAPRQDAGLGYDIEREQLILFGGRLKTEDATHIHADTWLYDVSKDSWKLIITPRHPPARYGFTSGVSGDYFYITMGRGTNGVLFSDIWQFNFLSETWTQLPVRQTARDDEWVRPDSVQPSPRFSVSGGVVPNSTRLYLSHGVSETGFSDTYSYSFTEQHWFKEYSGCSSYSPVCAHARFHQASTMASTHQILMYGGCLSVGGGGGPCPSSDTWLFDAQTKRWEQSTSCNTPRTDAALAMLPSVDGARRAILYGGVEHGRQIIKMSDNYRPQEVSVFNPDTLKWTRRAAEGDIPSRRSSMSIATGANGVFIFGGVVLDSLDGLANNDLYLLLGDSRTVDLASKISDCSPPHITYVTIHGVLMLTGWGIFLPWGAFCARYMKHKHPSWFHLHRFFQVIGLVLTISGFTVAVVTMENNHFQFLHGILGLCITTLSILQPISGIIESRVLPQMTNNTVQSISHMICRFIHRQMGRWTVLLAMCNVSLGLFVAVVSATLYWLWHGYVGVLLVVFFCAEVYASYRRSVESSALPRPEEPPLIARRYPSEYGGPRSDSVFTLVNSAQTYEETVARSELANE